MLEKLKNFKYTPTKEGIIYFVSDILGIHRYDIGVIAMLCNHAPGYYHLSAPDMLNYCLAFRWLLHENDKYFLTEEISKCVSDKVKLNEKLMDDSIKILFEEELIKADMFVYDAEVNRIRFRNEMFPLEYSAIRNVLVSQGLFEVNRTFQRTYFYLAEEYINSVGIHIEKRKKKLSLEQLKVKLEKNALAGAMAEKFVLEFERKRLSKSMRDKIRIISNIDVAAGYDIVSYETQYSTEIDRFIEVKAVNNEIGFYWSENEYEVAKLKGTKYYLYLVNLENISKEDYRPMIICNPANSIMKSENWLVEAQTYHVRYVLNSG